MYTRNAYPCERCTGSAGSWVVRERDSRGTTLIWRRKISKNACNTLLPRLTLRSLGFRENSLLCALPPALARVLRENGCHTVAVREVGLRDANDTDIWGYALQEGAALITKDEDFADRCLFDQNQPVIVWLRIGNSSNQTLSRWLIPVWLEILRRIALGDRLIEVF